MEEVIKPPPILKTGLLKKLGGASGGHKNWKDRFFVLSNHLAYYPSEKEYETEPTKPLVCSATALGCRGPSFLNLLVCILRGFCVLLILALG